MTEYYVDGKKGNDAADGSEGRPFKTLRRAAAAARPSDAVHVRPAVYRESLVIRQPGAWIGEPGAILDGGYSHESALKGGDSWRNAVYRPPKDDETAVIRCQSDAVLIDGLTVRNSGDAGIAARAVKNLIIRNCHVSHTYGTAILVNGGSGWAEDVLIEGNTCTFASMMKFDPTRTGGGPQSVSGMIKVGRARRVKILRNRLVGGHGEGINTGKDIFDFEVGWNLIANSAHKMSYSNHAVDGWIHDNVLICTGDPAYLYLDGEAPAALACVDEKTRGTFTSSRNLRWERNLVVNCGIPLQVKPDVADTALTFDRNTFVYGSLTRKGPIVEGGHVVVRGNIFAVQKGAPTPSGTPDVVGGNLWTTQPPAGWRGDGDVVAEPRFVKPEMPWGTHDPFGLAADVAFNAAGFAPAMDGPAAKNGKALFGALEPVGVVEPPPPPDDEEPVVDWAALAGMARATLEQVSVASLANEAAREELEALLVELEKQV